MLPHTLNHLVINAFPYSSIVLTQACSIMASGPGQAKALLLGINARFFTGMTPIFYRPPGLLSGLPSEILHAVAEKLNLSDKLRFLSTCSTLRNLLPPEQTAWLPFQIVHDRLFCGPKPFDKSLGKRYYREILLRLLDPGTTDLKPIAIFAEKFHGVSPYWGRLSYTDIAKILEQVLQQSAQHVPQQWKKLASINLHLCITLSGIVTMKKLVEYGVNYDFFSNHFPAGKAQIETLLKNIKATSNHSALQCAMEADLRGILIDLITHPTTYSLCIAEALTVAAEQGNSAIVELCLENKVNVNLQNHYGSTALINVSSTTVAQLLLNHGANTNLQRKDGTTALMSASLSGRLAMVQLLLNHGAHINLQDKNGTTALIWACGEIKTDIVQLLLDRGADINLQDKNGKTALMMAAREKRYVTVQLLLNHSADVNLQHKDGSTALMFACKAERADIAQLLLDQGANVNLQDEEGFTALMIAATGWHETVRLLLSHGADVNLQHKDGTTALMMAMRGRAAPQRPISELLQDEEKLTALLMGKPEPVRLLLRRSTDVNEERTDIAQLLLDQGAKVNLQADNGLTALIMAAQTGEPETVQLLLSHGADVNLQDKNGRTALMNTCREERTDVAQLLLDRGADINLQDEYEFTVLAYACHIKNKALVELLLQRGAKITSRTLSIAEKKGDDDILQLLRNAQQPATQET